MKISEEDAKLLYDTLQDLLMSITDGYITRPKDDEKASVINDAIGVMWAIEINAGYEITKCLTREQLAKFQARQGN